MIRINQSNHVCVDSFLPRFVCGGLKLGGDREGGGRRAEGKSAEWRIGVVGRFFFIQCCHDLFVKNATTT